jgi:trans-aconitate methyltransferase
VGWVPEDYVQGNFFQNQLNEEFRKSMSVMPFGKILDVGCGDGQYTHQWAEQTQGDILGIDNSKEMIRYANLNWPRSNLAFEVQNIEQYQSRARFDFILSFWCLHWTNLQLSLPNIYHVLKPKGQVYAVFSSCSENTILHILHELAKQGAYKTISERYLKSIKSTQSYILELVSTLNRLSFKKVHVKIESTRVLFPGIEYFKSLLLALPFIKNCAAEISAGLVNDMALMFQNRCEHNYGGTLYYETRPIYLEAIK